MKAKVTITAIVDMDEGDIKLLRNASPDEVMVTLLGQDTDVNVRVETGKKAGE